MQELKPCPFCGGQAVMWNSGNIHPGYKTFRVCCSGCHVTQADGIYYTERDAKTDWNRRADNGGEEAEE